MENKTSKLNEMYGIRDRKLLREKKGAHEFAYIVITLWIDVYNYLRT